ncbi:hypothetical protein FRC00_014486, partial [Tulasnella sp. 408]
CNWLLFNTTEYWWPSSKHVQVRSQTSVTSPYYVVDHVTPKDEERQKQLTEYLEKSDKDINTIDAA